MHISFRSTRFGRILSTCRILGLDASVLASVPVLHTLCQVMRFHLMQESPQCPAWSITKKIMLSVKQSRSTEGCSKLKSPGTRQVQEN